MLACDFVASRPGDGLGAKASRNGCERRILQCDLCSLCFRELLSICCAKWNPFSQVLPPLKMLSQSWAYWDSVSRVCGDSAWTFSLIQSLWLEHKLLRLLINFSHLLRSCIVLFVLYSLLCNGFALKAAIMACLPAWSRIGHVTLYLHYCPSATLNSTSWLLYTRKLQLKFQH